MSIETSNRNSMSIKTSNPNNQFQGFSPIIEEEKINPLVKNLITSIKKKKEEEEKQKFEENKKQDEAWNNTPKCPYGKQFKKKSLTIPNESLLTLISQRKNLKTNLDSAEKALKNFDTKKTDPSYKDFKTLQNKHLRNKIALIFFTIVIPSIIFALSFLTGGAGLATLFTLQLYAIIPPLAAKIAIVVVPIIIGALGTFGLSLLNNCLIKKFSSQKNAYSTTQLLLITITSLGVGLATGGLGGGLLYTLVLTKPVLDIAALIVSVAAPLLFGTTIFGILSAIKTTFAINWANEEHAPENAAAKNKIKDAKKRVENTYDKAFLKNYFHERGIKNKINSLIPIPVENSNSYKYFEYINKLKNLDPAVHKLLFERNAYIPKRTHELKLCKRYLNNEIKNKKYWPKIISIIFTVGAIIASAVLFGFLGYGVLLAYPAVLTLKATILAILLSSSIGGGGAGVLSSILFSIFLVNKKVEKRITKYCGYRETLGVGKNPVNLGEELKKVNEELKYLEERKEKIRSYEEIFTGKITEKNSYQRFAQAYLNSNYYKDYKDAQQQKTWFSEKNETKDPEKSDLEIVTSTNTFGSNPPPKKEETVISDKERLLKNTVKKLKQKIPKIDPFAAQEKIEKENKENDKKFDELEAQLPVEDANNSHKQQNNEIDSQSNDKKSKEDLELDNILNKINNGELETDKKNIPVDDDDDFYIENILNNMENLEDVNDSLTPTTPVDTADQTFNEEEGENTEDFLDSLLSKIDDDDDE